MAQLEDYIAGGYYIVRPNGKEDRQSDLLPETLLSVAADRCDVGPSALWARRPEIERARTDPLGIPEEHLAEAAEWVIEASTRVGHWPDVLTSPDDGRAFAKGFSLPIDDLLLVGIGLPSTRVDAFLALEDGDFGCVSGKLATRERLAPGGRSLGFELLQVDNEIEHSWLCYGMEQGANRELGVAPGDWGLIESIADAERAAAWASDQESCEPDLPFDPWLIARYSWN